MLNKTDVPRRSTSRRRRARDMTGSRCTASLSLPLKPVPEECNETDCPLTQSTLTPCRWSSSTHDPTASSQRSGDAQTSKLSPKKPHRRLSIDQSCPTRGLLEATRLDRISMQAKKPLRQPSASSLMALLDAAIAVTRDLISETET